MIDRHGLGNSRGYFFAPKLQKSVIFLQDLTLLEISHNNHIKITEVSWWHERHRHIKKIAKSLYKETYI